jgi:sigma-B regulation protein RsbU (phosphoserine phosphatase)
LLVDNDLEATTGRLYQTKQKYFNRDVYTLKTRDVFATSCFKGKTVLIDPAQDKLHLELRLLFEAVYGPSLCELVGLDVGRAYWGASKEFPYGGDIVDVFQYGNGCTSLAVVDISGHGIQAATHTFLIKNALRAYVSQGLSAADAIRALNRLCIENAAFDGDADFFATAFFAIIDATRESMQYVSAGHEAAFIVTSHGHRPLEATGPILGLLDDDRAFSQKTVELHMGDIVVAVTDGFTEARNEEGAFLGARALASVVKWNFELSAEQQAQSITARAYSYAGARLLDDVAALVVKVA